MNNYMKRIVRYGFARGVTFMVFMTAISYWISGNSFVTALVIGIQGGFLVGIANSLLIYKFSVPKYVLDAVSVDIDTDEIITFQTPANYTSGKEPVSGKLFLTTKRLIFVNHKQEKNLLQFSIDLRDIETVATFKTLKVFGNGLSVQTTSKVKHKFIVDRLKEWITRFDKTKNGIQHRLAVNTGFWDKNSAE